jgi:hypothetical protein
MYLYCNAPLQQKCENEDGGYATRRGKSIRPASGNMLLPPLIAANPEWGVAMHTEEIFTHAPKVISQEQRQVYYDQGYLAFPGLIGPEDLERLRAATSRVVDLARPLTSSNQGFDLEAGHTAERPKLRRAAYLDDLDAAFWDLTSNSVLPDISADLLGPNIRFREMLINFKWAGGGAEVKWHQDIVFYPHTNAGTLQFLVMLEDVGEEQGPLQVVPGSHKLDLYEHYDEAGNWTGAMTETDLARVPMDQAVSLLGPAGTVSVHHSRTVHGSTCNLSSSSRPAIVVTYSAADAVPYTAPSYPSSRYGRLVRGQEPRFAHHEALHMPLPPDWSNGYTSIFEHQEHMESAS